MNPKYCRYTPAMIKSLGMHRGSAQNQTNLAVPNGLDDIQRQTLGQFKNIIDILYSSTDGRLDSNPMRFIGDNVSDTVKTFAANVLLCPITSLKAAPDDDTAFDMLIPRSAQSAAELKPYLNYLRDYVSQKQAESNTAAASD